MVQNVLLGGSVNAWVNESLYLIKHSDITPDDLPELSMKYPRLQECYLNIPSRDCLIASVTTQPEPIPNANPNPSPATQTRLPSPLLSLLTGRTPSSRTPNVNGDGDGEGDEEDNPSWEYDDDESEEEEESDDADFVGGREEGGAREEWDVDDLPEEQHVTRWICRPDIGTYNFFFLNQFFFFQRPFYP